MKLSLSAVAALVATVGAAGTAPRATDRYSGKEHFSAGITKANYERGLQKLYQLKSAYEKRRALNEGTYNPEDANVERAKRFLQGTYNPETDYGTDLENDSTSSSTEEHGSTGTDTSTTSSTSGTTTDTTDGTISKVEPTKQTSDTGPPPAEHSGLLTATSTIFPPGSLAYMEFTDCECWYMGTVLSFDPTTLKYTVRWDDKDEMEYSLGDKIVGAVTGAGDFIADAWGPPEGRDWPQIYPVETPVYYRFERNWWFGKISSFDKPTGTYTVTWSDGSTNDYKRLHQVSQMVFQAAQYVLRGGNMNLGLEGKFNVGEAVYMDFTDDGWYKGTITAIDITSGKHTVTWSDNSVDYYHDLAEIAQMVDQAIRFDTAGYRQPTQVYAFGTLVRKEFKDGWWRGKVVNYKSGTYTVQWSDASTNEYDDLEEMVEMTTDAVSNIRDGDYQGKAWGYEYPQAFASGTLLHYHFKTGWYWGRVSGFEKDKYKVTWSDFSGYYYSDLAMMNQMALQAADKVMGKKAGDYAIGTRVYYKFPKGWWTGHVTAFIESSGIYTVTWSDKSKTTYDDSNIIKQMADQYKSMITPQEIATGTPVWKEFSDGWYAGEITGYDERKAEYEVTYTDDTVFHYTDLDEVIQMTKDRPEITPSPAAPSSVQSAANGKGGMSPGGKAILSIAIIAAFAAGAFFVYKKKFQNVKDVCPPEPNTNLKRDFHNEDII